MNDLRNEFAARFLPVLLANVTTRYPYHDAHLTQQGELPVDPTVVHPSFGNSFDWHSSVHSHWTALQIAEFIENSGRNGLDQVNRLRQAIEANLTSAHLAVERAYLEAHPWYERPYGWAWALMLAALSERSASARTQKLRAPLRELAEMIRRAAVRWLEILPEPVRHGTHANTAFALGLMHDSSRVLGFNDLEHAVDERARLWFQRDRGWPMQWERSGNDFLSPGLAEADLMRRILAPTEFATWWDEFLPGESRDARMFVPIPVADVADGQIVHLHGLNLSRAGMLAQIASILHLAGERDEQLTKLLLQACLLFRAGVEYAVTGYYLSTHWLATYAWIAACALDETQSLG